MEARKALTSQNKQCTVCNSEFSCVSARNKHMKNFHNELVNNPKKSHIICPLCTETVLCGNYDKLDTHLEVNHEEKLENETITFADVHSFEEWFEDRKIKTTYACTRLDNRGGYMQKYYNCNRSNWRGYNSNCQKQTEKAGALIKINGVCPSRLNIRFYHTGQITVKFCKSHVGHEEEIRPHSNTYQYRLVTKAHKTADIMKANNVEVQEVGFGEFKVKSSSSNSFYDISYNKICETHCKTSYCKICKICIHNYRCNCPEYAIKSTICKHIHLVCLHGHRQGSESVLGDVAQLISENKSSDINAGHNEEIEHFVREQRSENNELHIVDENRTKEAEISTLTNFLRSLDNENYKKCMGKFFAIMEEVSRSAGHKRKMVKQEFFPSKRKQ